MSELVMTLNDILAGGKVRWPAKRSSAVEAAQQQGESPSQQHPRTSSLGYRPKRPAPAKPPTSKRQSHGIKEREESLVIGNPVVHSQEDPKMERDLLSGTRALSQDAGTTAFAESEQKAKASKSQKPFVQKKLSSSTEPLLEEYSGSWSQKEPTKPESFPVEFVPPPPVKVVNESTTTNEQRKKKRRKSGEIKFEGEGTKSKSKTKSKRKTEHHKLEKRVHKSSKDEEPAQDQQGTRTMFKMSEELPEEGELPLPGEIAEAAANEALMMGAGELEEKEDFILEPPLKFSQSSVDYLDDFGDVEDSGPLSMDFAPPPESSEDEIEEEPHPPIVHDKQPHTHRAPKPMSEKVPAHGLDARKKHDSNQKPLEKATGSSKSGAAATKTEQMDFPSMEDEWKELDYPVRNPPKWAPETTTTRQANKTFPQNQFNEFAHRDALEEEEDDESELGVVLDEDVAALLW